MFIGGFKGVGRPDVCLMIILGILILLILH